MTETERTIGVQTRNDVIFKAIRALERSVEDFLFIANSWQDVWNNCIHCLMPSRAACAGSFGNMLSSYVFLLK